jgi:hypothetical protein
LQDHWEAAKEKGRSRVHDQNPGPVGGAADEIVSGAIVEREGDSDTPESRGRNPVAEQDDRPDAVVLARDPDQSIDLLVQIPSPD